MISARDDAGATTAKIWYSSRWLAVAIVAAALAAPDVYASGQVAVSNGGTPSVSVPVTVPPGIAGMAPNLTLLYSAAEINGPVGYGWALQGVSLITRCPSSKLIDGATRDVDYSVNDKLCLDGQRLIQTDASNNVINGAVVNPSLTNPFQQNDSLGGVGQVREYRTEKEIYARVRAYGYASGDATGASGPAYFKVWTKSGLVYEYGVNNNATANANVTAQGKSVVVAWPVSRVSDTVGNYMDFQYEQRDVSWGSGIVANTPSLGREWNLLEVRYAGNGAQLPTNKVAFEYADRVDNAGGPQDRHEAYHKGSKNLSVRLLKTIRTYINWPADQANLPATAVKVKAIRLAYETGPVSGRSRLNKITECAGAAETACLPPVTLTYANGGGTVYQPDPTFRASPLSTLRMQSLQGNYGVILGDFDGDGKTDLIRWSDNPAENQLYLSAVGGGSLAQSPGFNLTAQHLVTSNGCYQSLVGDFDGDGLPDILTYSAATNSAGQACPAFSQPYIYFNKGNGLFNGVAITGPTLSRLSSQPRAQCTNIEICHIAWSAGANFYLLDINGDGRLDIVTTVLPALASNGIKPSPCPARGCTQVWLSNGDGSFTSTPTNLANVSIYADPAYSGGIGSLKNTADINGDGFQDLLGLDPSYYINLGLTALDPSQFTSFTAYQSSGDGNFIGADTSSSCMGTRASAIDFNGDARADCVTAGTVAGGNRLYAAISPQAFQPIANFNLVSPGQELGGIGVGIQVADINGDGRGDIIRWKDDPSGNALYLSNGDGTFRTDPTFNLAGVQLQKSDFSAAFILGDFTGHGNAEILRLVASPSAASDATRNLLYVKSDPTPPDQLLGVTSSTGASTTLTWVSLANSAVGSSGNRYTSDRTTSQAAAYPMVDIPSSAYVVATVTEDTGVGSQRLASEYSYTGLKGAFNGAGLFGFRETRRQNQAPDGSNITVLTQFLQNANYRDLASLTETRLGALSAVAPQVISRSTYIYCDATSPGGAQTGATNVAPCPTTAKVRHPYLYQSTDLGWDITGASLPSVTTTNTFNATGDATQISVQTSGTALGLNQVFNKVTSNSYFAANTSADNWLLGRLQRASVQSDAANSLPSIATSAGSAPLASATQGVLLAVTMSPTSLSVNAVSPGVVSGTATAVATGGTAPYTYSWVHGSGTRSSISSTTIANPTFSASVVSNDNFSETWAVTVTDAVGVTKTGNLTVTFTAPPPPPVLTLTNCTSVTPTISPATSRTTCTVGNTGQAATTAITYSSVSGTSVTGPTGTCAAGAVCGTVTVTSGTAPGVYAGTLTATPNIGASASTAINLTVNATPPALSFSACSAVTPTTSPTAAQATCTLSNTGQTAVSTVSYSAIGGATVTGPTGACAAGAVCGAITVNSGTTPGVYAGTLTATPNIGASAATAINLTVNATPPALSFSACSAVTPTTSPTAAQATCTLNNTGQTAVSTVSYSAIGGATVTGPTGTCAAGSVCGTVTVTTGPSPGTYAGTLTATPNFGAATSTGISLTVNPPAPTTTTISLSTGSLTMPSIAKGTIRVASISVTNTGPINATGLTFNVVSYASPSGSLSSGAGSTCTSTLGVGATCVAQVEYDAACVGGATNGLATISGTNFPSVSASLAAATNSAGKCQ